VYFAVAGVIGAFLYWLIWVAADAAQGSPNTDAYLLLGLVVTVPLLLLASVGCLAYRRWHRAGASLIALSGLLLAGWGLFIAIDIGPGWFLSGLAILAGGLITLPNYPETS